MADEFLSYYQDELTFLRQMGAEFARKYPGPASQLDMEAGRSKDPHVERMLEAFAFLAARIHLKLNDEFPAITESLLSVLYPHYLRPIPSMALAQFHLDPQQGQLTTGLPVKRHSMLFTKPVDGYQCRFRTCYDLTLWPIQVTDAQWTTPDRLKPGIPTNAVAALRLEIAGLGDTPLGVLPISNLQFCLHGESRVVHALYELLCCNCSEIWVRNPQKRNATAAPLTRNSLRPMGFDDAEAMLPFSRRSFSGYRLFQEYFAFPEKFFFFDLGPLGPAWSPELTSKAEIVFLIDRFELRERQQLLETSVSKESIRLGCSPVVNLFPQTCEPILVDQLRSEYPVIPDIHRRSVMEVFSVDKVLSLDLETRSDIVHEPFYSYRHGTSRDRTKTFWHTRRAASMRRDDDGTDLFMSLVDLSGRQMHPQSDTVTVRSTCTNRELPGRLPLGTPRGKKDDETDFELEGAPAIKSIIALTKPSPTLRPELGGGLLLRLVSHLSLNYLSLVSDGKEALQEILKLYNFSDDPAIDKQIAGIATLTSSREFGPVESEDGIAFVRGTRVDIQFDEEQFTGGGVYLFASVIERFLGLYASMNSFSQLVARTQQRKEPVREWPARAGEQILL